MSKNGSKKKLRAQGSYPFETSREVRAHIGLPEEVDKSALLSSTMKGANKSGKNVSRNSTVPGSQQGTQDPNIIVYTNF
jgi:hypothetical protein